MGGGAAAIGPYALDEAPTLTEDVGLADEPDTAETRLGGWKRRLLDLSLRDRLRNFKPGKASVALVCGDPAALEDRLAEGRKLKIYPGPRS